MLHLGSLSGEIQSHDCGRENLLLCFIFIRMSLTVSPGSFFPTHRARWCILFWSVNIENWKHNSMVSVTKTDHSWPKISNPVSSSSVDLSSRKRRQYIHSLDQCQTTIPAQQLLPESVQQVVVGWSLWEERLDAKGNIEERSHHTSLALVDMKLKNPFKRSGSSKFPRPPKEDNDPEGFDENDDGKMDNEECTYW